MGEIAVAGHVLARGYVNNSSLTAKHFVEAPGLAAGLTPSRIYLTGDIGRCTADGSMCLVGRKDQMVKVNGIRVESAESEQQLQQQGGMFASCVVEWLRDEQSIAKLAAFFQVGAPRCRATILCDKRFKRCTDALLVLCTICHGATQSTSSTKLLETKSKRCLCDSLTTNQDANTF